ncbi:hypothetical protein ACFL0L_05135 [Patescibacteria group bacterium]
MEYIKSKFSHKIVAFFLILNALIFGYILDVAAFTSILTVSGWFSSVVFIIFMIIPLSILIATFYNLARDYFTGAMSGIRKILEGRIVVAQVVFTWFTMGVIIAAWYLRYDESMIEGLSNTQPSWIYYLLIGISFIGGELYRKMFGESKRANK